MNRTTILSPTVASLAIIRDNPAAPPGAAIRHVAVLLASTGQDGETQFAVHEQSFAGSDDGKDVTDWLGTIIPEGADIALRCAASMIDPSPATDLEAPSPWWPIADMAWLRQRFGEEPRIYTLDLSDREIFETLECMDLPCAFPCKAWDVRANLAAGEAQAIWLHLLVRTCSDDVAACHSDAWKAWNRARKG
ncbi:MAG: hypothetical protein ACJLS3_00280 [Erythrobacter sp.]